MWIFTIIAFFILISTLASTYFIIKKALVIKKYFYIKHFIIQLTIFLMSLFLIYLLAIGGSGHHVDTDIERILGELSIYTLIITLFINLISIILVFIKLIKNKMTRRAS